METCYACHYTTNILNKENALPAYMMNTSHDVYMLD